MVILGYSPPVETVKKLFKEYKLMIKDREDEKKLPTIRAETENMTDDEFDTWVYNNAIHRDCHWEVEYDQRGNRHARIVCEFK